MPDRLSLEEYLAIPYVLDVAAVEGDDGQWICRVAYDELPGCISEASTPLEALDRLEALKTLTIVSRYEQGLPVPTPRLPLRS